MATVRLGNHHALDNMRPVRGEQVTTIHIPDDDSHEDRLRNITDVNGLWPRIASGPPAWVDSDDPELAQALAEYFECPVGEPDMTAPDDARELTE